MTAVIGLVGAQGFGLPAPGQTVLIAAGIYAGTGQLNLAIVLALGFVAAASGDNIGCAIGHYGGRPPVLRFGRHVFLTRERLAETECFLSYNALGTAGWVGLWVLATWPATTSGAIYAEFRRYQNYVLAAALARWLRGRRSPNIGSTTCQRSNASNSRCW